MRTGYCHDSVAGGMLLDTETAAALAADAISLANYVR
jgi:hypothetical protein